MVLAHTRGVQGHQYLFGHITVALGTNEGWQLPDMADPAEPILPAQEASICHFGIKYIDTNPAPAYIEPPSYLEEDTPSEQVSPRAKLGK